MIGTDGAVVVIVSSTDLLKAYQKMVDLMQRQLIEINLIEFSLLSIALQVRPLGTKHFSVGRGF